MYHALELLQSSKVILRVEILDLINEEDVQVLSAKAMVSDDSLLYIRELTTKTETRYSYHWQTRKGKLICRWDNAPHHRVIQTFPHHKHRSKDENVFPSEEVTIEQVLTLIAKQVNARKRRSVS